MSSAAEYEVCPTVPNLETMWQQSADDLFSTPVLDNKYAETHRQFITTTLAVMETQLPPNVKHVPDVAMAHMLNDILSTVQTRAQENNMPGAVLELRRSSKKWHQYIIGEILACVAYRGETPEDFVALVFGLERGDSWYTKPARNFISGYVETYRS